MGRYDEAEAKRTSGVAIAIILALLLGGGLLYLNRSERQTRPEIKELKLPQRPDELTMADESVPDDVIADQVLPDSSVLTEPEGAEQPNPLPALSSSDQAFREAMRGVSASLAPWLKADHLIRRYTTIANDFSQGLVLEKHMRFLKQSQPFSVKKTEEGLFIAEESYRRYDKLAKAIDAVDVKAAAAVFRHFMPLFQEVFDDFAYPPDRPMDDIFLKSAAQILAAPVIERPIAGVRPSVFYKFADDKLEGLSPVSKQMLRMGPKNTRIIQNKIRQLVQEWVNLRHFMHAQF